MKTIYPKFRLLLVLFTLLLAGAEIAAYPPFRYRKLRYKEDFYRLYYLRSDFQNSDLKRNLFWLNIAIGAAWAPPWKALAYCQTEEQYKKYKLLMKMHLNYLMTKNEIFIAAGYDKHTPPPFYTKVFKEDILNSFELAADHYKKAGWYWDWVLKYKKEIDEKYKQTRVDLSFAEEMLYRIDTDELNYRRVIDRQLKKLEKNKAFYKEP